MADTVDMSYPFAGHWQVQNSPANRVPSHGTALFGLSYAIDFVPVEATGRSAAFTPISFLRPEPPTAFPGFGRAITAPVDGMVVATHSAEPDHEAFRGLPSVGYALTQRRRLRRGWLNVIGNHVLIETHTPSDATVFVVMGHLQQDSLVVQEGQQVRRGQEIAQCGNSGNSTEPHLHMHALDGKDMMHSNAVPITFDGGLPRNNSVVTV